MSNGNGGLNISPVAPSLTAPVPVATNVPTDAPHQPVSRENEEVFIYHDRLLRACIRVVGVLPVILPMVLPGLPPTLQALKDCTRATRTCPVRRTALSAIISIACQPGGAEAVRWSRGHTCSLVGC